MSVFKWQPSKWRKMKGAQRCDTLRKGNRFVAIDGRTYTFDHVHRGVCWVRPDGEKENICFCACSTVNKSLVRTASH